MLQLSGSSSSEEGRAALRVRVVRMWAVLSLAGLVVCGLITQWYASVNDRRIEQHFAVEAQRVVDQIAAQMRSYEKGIRGTRGALLVGGQEHISAENYRIYAQSRDIAAEFPGARGFGYIRRVPADGVKAYAAEVRREGNSSFDIRQLAPHDGEVDVIHRIGPLEPNRNLIGLDIASDSNLSTAAQEALVHDSATMTGLIAPDRTLDAGLHSFMIMLPVYRPDMPHQTPEQRQAATFGWAFALLDAKEALRAVRIADDMQLSIRDSAAGPFLSLGILASPGKTVLQHNQVVDLYGRQWAFTAVAGARYVEILGFTPPWKIFVTGAFIVLLLSALRASRWAASLRRRELHAQHDLLVSLVSNSTDAIVGESLDGKVVSWNAEAATKFGYTAEEAIGKPVVGLILPRERAAEDADLLARSAEGRRIPPFDTTRLSKDGTLIHVSVTAIPVTGRDGRIFRHREDHPGYQRAQGGGKCPESRERLFGAAGGLARRAAEFSAAGFADHSRCHAFHDRLLGQEPHQPLRQSRLCRIVQCRFGFHCRHAHARCPRRGAIRDQPSAARGGVARRIADVRFGHPGSPFWEAPSFVGPLHP